MPTSIEHSTADFAAAVESAKLRALYNFAYGLSHEINNPLANIATRAQTLLADEKDPERRRRLATIVQQAFKAHEMIADLMLFAHPPRMQPRETDLVQLVDTIIGELSEQATEKNTRLHRVGADAALLANVDPTAMAVAIKAIVQNALEALQSDGAVEIRLDLISTAHDAPAADTEHSVLSTQYLAPLRSLHESHPTTIVHPASPSPVPSPLSAAFSTPHSTDPLRGCAGTLRTLIVLTITDTGPGIPPDVRASIFDPFFCGREAGRGLGLGLSKAWRIVDLHGGRIEVESEQGHGATFRVILPADS